MLSVQYELDRKERFVTTEEHPLHPGEITATWLSYHLGRIVDTFETKVIGQDRGFVGTVARLNWPQDGAKTSVIAKVTNQAETGWYRESTALQPKLIPTYLGGSTTMLLLEDLAGLEPADMLNGATADQVRSVIAAMEKVRAAWPNRPEWLASWSGGDIARTSNRFRTTLPQLNTFTDVPGHVSQFLPLVAGQLPTLVARLCEGPTGVIHRDLHLDNVFFRDNQPVLTDWQNVSWGPVAIDIAHQLVEMPSIEDRRSIEGPFRDALGDDLVLGLVWYVVGAVDWVINGSRDNVHPRKLAVMDNMLGSGKLFAAMADWDATSVIDRLRD